MTSTDYIRKKMMYFRIEKETRNVGDLISGDGGYPLDMNIEEILRIERPEHCFARNCCVYMRNDRKITHMGVGYDYGYVHEIEPIGDVQVRDTFWIGALQYKYKSNKSRVFIEYSNYDEKELAKKYCVGEIHSDVSLEFIALSAKIISVDKSPTKISDDFEKALQDVRLKSI